MELLPLDGSAPCLRPSSTASAHPHSHFTMPVSRLSFLLLLVLISVALALDCRKFSFAPACRGILLKRASAPQEYDFATKTCTNPADVIGKLLESAMLAGYTQAVDMAFLRSEFNKAVTETMALKEQTV